MPKMSQANRVMGGSAWCSVMPSLSDASTWRATPPPVPRRGDQGRRCKNARMAAAAVTAFIRKASAQCAMPSAVPRAGEQGQAAQERPPLQECSVEPSLSEAGTRCTTPMAVLHSAGDRSGAPQGGLSLQASGERHSLSGAVPQCPTPTAASLAAEQTDALQSSAPREEHRRSVRVTGAAATACAPKVEVEPAKPVAVGLPTESCRLGRQQPQEKARPARGIMEAELAGLPVRLRRLPSVPASTQRSAEIARMGGSLFEHRGVKLREGNWGGLYEQQSSTLRKDDQTERAHGERMSHGIQHMDLKEGEDRQKGWAGSPALALRKRRGQRSFRQ